MITRTQFLVFPLKTQLGRIMFAGALDRMFCQETPPEKLYITIEVKPQYENLRRKLAKRAAKKRRK